MSDKITKSNTFRPLPPERRPQDPYGDGTGWTRFLRSITPFLARTPLLPESQRALIREGVLKKWPNNERREDLRHLITFLSSCGRASSFLFVLLCPQLLDRLQLFLPLVPGNVPIFKKLLDQCEQ